MVSNIPQMLGRLRPGSKMNVKAALQGQGCLILGSGHLGLESSDDRLVRVRIVSVLNHPAPTRNQVSSRVA